MCFLEFKSMSDFTCQKSKVCENTGLLTHFLFVLFYSISTFGYFWLSCSQQTWLFWVRASCLLSISSSYMALFNRPGKCFEKSISKTAVGVAVFFEFEKLWRYVVSGSCILIIKVNLYIHSFNATMLARLSVQHLALTHIQFLNTLVLSAVFSLIFRASFIS